MQLRVVVGGLDPAGPQATWRYAVTPVSPEFLGVLSEPVDVDAILAGLPEELNDPGVDRWGGASLVGGTEGDD